MILKPGIRLRSAVCDTEVIVVRAPTTDVDVGCGGAPMLAEWSDPPAGVELDPDLARGALIGKRYADADLGLELLCVRAGAGTLTGNGEPLAMKAAKPLPASD